MPIIVLDEPLDRSDYCLWNAVALPTNCDDRCGKGITYDILSQHDGGIDFVRRIKHYRYEWRGHDASKSNCRYFAYAVGLRFILLNWRGSWKSNPSPLILKHSLKELADTYRQNAIDSILFPNWGFGVDTITHEQLLLLLDEMLGHTGLLIAVEKLR